jgi:beta-lactamase class A
MSIPSDSAESFEPSLNRRAFLGATATLIFSTLSPTWAAPRGKNRSAKQQLEKLEKELGGRIGLYALDTGSGAQLSHRAGERFPLCSTFKVLAAGAILRKSEQFPDLLQRHIRYEQSNLVDYSPVTEKHVAHGMTVAQLCAAAIQYSDNTAGNLLIRMLGGPAAVTAFARSLGDREFRLDRWETALNSAIPGDRRDTSTPAAMGRSLQQLVLGNALKPEQRDQLQTWLCGNTTGSARIKAGIPSDWKIGDKTGGGSYGTANDIAVVWPPQRAPLVVAIYTTRRQKEAKARNDIVVSTARVVADWFKAN